MYYPILRGKLNELLALRELAQLELKNFTPVIEPVKKDIKALVKTIESLNEYSIEPYIIINPTIGDFASDPYSLFNALKFFDNIEYQVLYSINQNTENIMIFLRLVALVYLYRKG